jgi:tetratricopeptide (TPR) repeat protein
MQAGGRNPERPGVRAKALVRAAFVLCAVGGFSGGVLAQNGGGTAPQSSPGTQRKFPSDQFDEAYAEFNKGSPERARKQFEAIVDGGVLANLDLRRQHATFNCLAILALRANDRPRAREYSVRSTSLAGAAATDWLVRFGIAHDTQDGHDVVLSLLTIARQWPASLTSVDARVIYSAATWTDGTPELASAHYDLMRALFDSKWQQKYVGEPSSLWFQLVQLHLERGERDAALAVAARVTSPEALVRMRADKRFDALRAANPQRFDVQAAVEAELKLTREQVARSPDVLEPVMVLAQQLILAHRYAEALQLLDAALKRAASLTAETKPYVDGGRYFPWLLDNRARALVGLGRFDEAVRQRVEASRLQEQGQDNVSQMINLGWLYVELRRPTEALEALRKVGTPSNHGRAEIEGVRLRAALQLHDQSAAQEALEYLRAHGKEDVDSFQSALLAAGAMDEAADLMVQRLSKVESRTGALWALQDFAGGTDTPTSAEQRARWQQLRSTARVVAALESVGRVERYSLLRPEW